MRHVVGMMVLSLAIGCGSGDEEGSDTSADTGTDTGSDTGTDTRLEAHDCTFATATDLTGATAVTITDTSAWSVGHSACVKVDVGTAVTWEGNFDSHPLQGGVSPTEDASSPIDIAGPGSGATPVVVTFTDAGDYPYFCGIHTGTMTGVVYVGG